MVRTLLWYGILIGMMASSAAAQNDFSCGPRKLTKLAITTPSVIYLKCNTPWPDIAVVPGRFELWAFPDDWKADPTKGPQQYTSGSIMNWTQDPARYLELNLGQSVQANKKYILILHKAATPTVIDLYVEFSTEGKGQLRMRQREK